jgi:hypothetical protein
MELYLSSYEYQVFSTPKSLLESKYLSFNNRNCLLVKLKEPVIGNSYGFNQDISQFILVGRFEDVRLKELTIFPIEVHVFIYEEGKKWEDMINIAWACLYNNLVDAEAHKI